MLLATRVVVQESLDFSPFDLVFGHTVRGKLTVVKEGWLNMLKSTKQYNLFCYGSEFKYILYKSCG